MSLSTEPASKEFPKSSNGLYGRGLDRCMHLIDEDLELMTLRFLSGHFGTNLPGPQKRDAIFVEKDLAEILIRRGGTELAGL